MRVLLAFIFFVLIFLNTNTSMLMAAKKCSTELHNQLTGLDLAALEQAWGTTQKTVDEIASEFSPETRATIQSILTAMVSKNHIMLFGDPGGAKTMLSNMMLDAMKEGLGKETKIFSFQFNKMTTEGVIIGSPAINKVIQQGVYEVNVTNTLMDPNVKGALLDEVEKSNPAIATSLLGPLNERMALHGNQVFHGNLRTAILTSNKNIHEYLISFEDDRSAGEALMDRIILKQIVPAQILEDTDIWKIFSTKIASQKKGVKKKTIALFVEELEQLAKRVEISDEVLADLTKVISGIDALMTVKSDNELKQIRIGEGSKKPYVQANQYSIRTNGKLVEIFRAAYVVDQLMKGLKFSEINLKPGREDILIIANGAIYGGPGKLKMVKGADGKLTVEDDGVIDQYINLSTTSSGEKANLQFVKEERNILARQIEGVVNEPNTLLSDNKKIGENTSEAQTGGANQKQIQFAKDKLKLAIESKKDVGQKELEVAYYNTMQTYFSINTQFLEVEHVTRAEFVSLLNGTNVYLFGPPGAAKTALTRKLFEMELKTISQVEKNEFAKLFFLQMHKMVSEGKITGYQVIQKMLDSGEYDVEVSSSLVGPDFFLSILDEAEKATPATLNALLGVINEKTAMHGTRKIAASIYMAAVTSNKTPAEFEAAYNTADISAARALLDRMPNKVYVSNKFSSDEALMQYLKSLDQGAPKEALEMQIQKLKPLLEKVTIPAQLGMAAAMTSTDYLSKTKSKMEISLGEFEQNPAEAPYKYVPASTASPRTRFALLNQWKAQFLINQLTSGVAFENLKYDMTFEDVKLLTQGFAYWGPYKVVNANLDGVIQFKLDSQIPVLLGRQQINERQQAMLKMIQWEAEEFVNSCNSVVFNLLIKSREIVAEFPEFFPGIFVDEAARLEWVKKQGFDLKVGLAPRFRAEMIKKLNALSTLKPHQRQISLSEINEMIKNEMRRIGKIKNVEDQVKRDLIDRAKKVAPKVNPRVSPRKVSPKEIHSKVDGE